MVPSGPFKDSDSMAKFSPPSDAARQRYRERLQPALRQAFDHLVRLLEYRRDDLRWHYERGQHISRLRPADRRGAKWAHTLAAALGGSSEWLLKALRFVELYPDQQGVEELERIGVTWTQLYFTFSVPDPKARHKLLRRAVRESWSDEDVRFTAQELRGSKRGGVGGRPRRAPGRHGAGVTLLQMGRLCQRLTAYFEDAWSAVGEDEWDSLVAGCPADELEKLLQDLASTMGAVAAAPPACGQVRKRVAELQHVAAGG
jgi:hypothetical protein